jgi:PAS domain S-box-containing protein
MNTELLLSENEPRHLGILHLEDSPADRELIAARLKADGLNCEITYAATRKEFESAIQQPHLDLILSDFSLPGYHGSAALAFAHHRRPDIPFIFLSATIGEERAVESLKSGATDYVIKNHLERLAPSVRRALREAGDRRRRRLAEEALRDSEERFRMVFESAPIGVICADAQGRILRTNRTLQQMLGYSESELLGMTVIDLTPPAELNECLKHLKELVSGNVERLRFDKSYIHKNGAPVSIELTSSPVWDSQGNFLYAIALVQDLSERKKAEEQMRDQARLLDMAEDAIIVKDAEGRVISWNHGAERLFGWTAAEATGRRVTELIYHAPADFEAIRQGLLSHGEWSGELHLKSNNRKEVIVNSRATLMRDEFGNPKSILVINTDITEKKRLEVQFLRAQRMESIGTLASGIAHDLNNILAPISIACQILRMTSTDDETLQLVERIESSSHRGADVVRQVLTFARGIEGERALLQVRHLIREIVKICEQTFPKNITISCVTGENLWPVMGDATQLHQVLLNLCVNARDAMPDGGTLRLQADNILVEDNSTLHADAKAGPYVLIQVKDSGTGIPPEIMEKIFEPFFTTKELGKGTGLGLSTVVGIIKSHVGAVNVYSEPGKGALFKIYLPAAAAPSPAVRPVTQQSLTFEGHGELILLVEDEAAIRDVTRKILVRHGYNVLTASDGVEGLGAHAQHAKKIAVVLTDMMMPRMEGMAMIRSLKKLDPKIKIIALSGLANLADQSDRTEELRALGIRHFLPKPCTPDALLSAIQSLLAST